MTTMGPSAHRPKQPVRMTFTSLSSPAVTISASKASATRSLPEEVQPVPPQIMT